MALIPPKHDLVFAELVDRLTDRFAGAGDRNVSVEVVEPGVIAVLRDNWSLRVHWEDEPHVQAESVEIASLVAANEEDAQIIRTCRRCITTAGDADPNMLFFNDYVFVLEVLDSIPDLYIFDQNSLDIKKTE